MAALFPEWSNTALRLGLLGLLGGAGSLPVLVIIMMQTPFGTGQYFPPDQPVQFDHRHHVRDDNIDCRYCHSTVEKSAHASIPATEVCMNCHNQVWNDSAMIEPIRRSYYSDKPIPWNKVHDMPDFVYFNHAAHVNKGVGCESCHGRVDQMAAIHIDKPMNMAWCLECHRSPEKNIRPKEKMTVMGWRSDIDGDGLADIDEDKNHDGVLDEGETDPTKADTDGDGAYDAIEVAEAHSFVNKEDPHAPIAARDASKKPAETGLPPSPDSCTPFNPNKPDDPNSCANKYGVRRLTNCTTCHR
jgi:hypothetical protein